MKRMHAVVTMVSVALLWGAWIAYGEPPADQNGAGSAVNPVAVF